MASLEELLAEEGFRRGKPRLGSSLPSYSMNDNRARRGRSRSDAFSRRSQSVLQFGSGRDRAGDLRRSVLQRRSSVDGYRRWPAEIRGFDIESHSESQETQEEFDERYRVSYPDSVVDELEADVASQQQQQQDLYSERFQHSNDLYEEDDAKSVPVSDLKLGEIAVKALVAIVTGYLRRFFKDEKFRASLHQACASCLGTDEDGENGVVSNLRQAAGVAERTATGSPGSQELKRAALQLSVITGLSSAELKDGFTSGVPNLHLAAFARLYLGVIYKFQKKDRASAKNLLQVFCDCPNQARSTLLPGLWDRLFLPHLCHLRKWYDVEAELITRSAGRMRLMKLLDEMYGNVLDEGTSQFGVYYREWLVEGADAPELPSIVAPQASFMGTATEAPRSLGSDELSSPRSAGSSQALVSKKLYESVFRQPRKNSRMEDRNERSNEEVTVAVEEIEEEDNQEDCSEIPTSTIHRANEWRANGYTGTRKLRPSTIKDIKVEAEGLLSSQNITEAKENELTLKKLAEAAFQPQAAVHRNNADSVSLRHNLHSPVHDLSNMDETKRTGKFPSNSDQNSPFTIHGTGPFGIFEDIDKGSFFSSIPKDFICPITGQLFQDPVTLESGQTYERAAIKEWFDQGNKTCPVTKRMLRSRSLAETNLVLKRVIDGWKSEHCKNLLLLATQMAGDVSKQEPKSKDETALFIIEQLLTGFSSEEQMENSRCLISLGGLQFLIRRLELGNLEEKARVSALMLCCIRANGFCRNYLAANIENACIHELLHCKQVGTRSVAVSLLVELICLNRRTAINSFIGGLHTESIVNTMHVLLVYLQSVPPEERVMVAVLLLHFDLMVERRRYSLYREEAVDSIILALNLCLFDTKLIPNTQRALLMLGGQFTLSGEITTEIWLLKQAGFKDDSAIDSISYDVDVDETILEEGNEEEEAREKEEWLKSVALVLLSSGKGSFLETICECLGSENSELVRVCLTTVAWLSNTLATLPLSKLQVSAFLVLVPMLKEILQSYPQVKHRVLASLSLLNFSKISECKVLLISSAEEIRNPLQNLVEVTWTAKDLLLAISQD